MKKLLLLGAGGFIGSALIPLLREEFELVCASRGARPHWRRIDLCRPETFPEENFDFVVNCAAGIGGEPEELARVNCEGLINTLQWARKAGCRRLVHFSSIRAIGKPGFLPIDENHPAKPRSLYQASKLFGEQALELPEYQELGPVVLRLPAPLGPGMNPRSIIPVFLARARANEDMVIYGRGSRRQNYMDVRDIAGATLLALTKDCGGLYNLGGKRTVSNLEAARICRQCVSSQSRIVFSDRPDAEEGDNWEIDSEKFRRDSGFAPQFSFEESVAWLAGG